MAVEGTAAVVVAMDGTNEAGADEMLVATGAELETVGTGFGSG